MEDDAASAAGRRTPDDNILISDQRYESTKIHRSGVLRINEPTEAIRKFISTVPGKAPTARRRSPYKIISTFPGTAKSSGPLTPRRSSSLVNLPRDKT
ncbi:hypothetical protein MA16_Dca006680 [Dendrobium catenatum]|uniref:Uncharacterized protein n=1 Tax=Dendrobium catenatum TaxID=906689 RepID=A0A2I0X5T5_9ASPA|nr:hypothetical protein MA16_Dca006680 [Dendrobium catenatum]